MEDPNYQGEEELFDKANERLDQAQERLDEAEERLDEKVPDDEPESSTGDGR